MSVDGAGLSSSSARVFRCFLADGALINLGNNQDVTLTHIKDTGIKINDANQIQFGDSGTQISQSADGVLDLVSDNEVEINGTTIDMNGVVDISGAVTTGSTITTTGSLCPHRQMVQDWFFFGRILGCISCGWSCNKSR